MTEQKFINIDLDELEKFEKKFKDTNNNQNIGDAKITKRIIQYFEDPKDSDALAEIKRLSSSAKKKSSKNVKRNLNDFNDNDINVINNTERNRLMFKDIKEENEKLNVLKPKKNYEQANFVRRTFQFPTQTYIPRNKNMSLYDEIKLMTKENPNNQYNETNDDDDEFNLNLDNIKIYEDRNEVKENNLNDIKKKEKEKENKNINHNTSDNKKANANNQSNLRRHKKLNTEIEGPGKKLKFADDIKPRYSHFDNRKIMNNLRYTYNPPDLLEEFKKKNNAVIENLHNKEKIVINEYQTKDKDKPKSNNYKTEYIWDKTINRLVEKRIYFDENQNIKENDKDIKSKENEPEEKNIKIKVNLKYGNRNEDDNNKEDNKDLDETKDVNKIEIRKRLGNSAIIKNEKKEINPHEEKDDKVKEEEKVIKTKKIEKPDKELNRSQRFQCRFPNYNTENTAEEKLKVRPEKEEIIIEKRTIITVENKNEDKIEKKEKNNLQQPKEEIIIEKRAVVNVDDKNKDKIDKEDQKENEPSKEEIIIEKRIEVNVEDDNKDKIDKKEQKEIEKPKEEIIIEKRIIVNEDDKSDRKDQKENEPPKEEIIIEKRTVIKENDENKDKVDEKDQNKIEPPKEDITIEKRKIIKIDNEKKDKIIDKIKEKEMEPKKEEINNETKKPSHRFYNRRQFYIRAKENKEKEKEKEPERIPAKNLTEIEDEPKYKKKQKYEPIKEEQPKIIYTKKVIIEDKKITNEPVEEKKVEKYREKEIKPRINPYSHYKRKNIRINMKSDNFNDEKDINDQKIKNNPYSNYMKTSKKANDKKMFRQMRADSDIIDDLEKIENYNVSTYLKNDLLQIYDSINEEFSDFKNDIFYTNINSFEIKMGEFDKKEIPYLKRVKKVDDLCRGRVTTEDMYKKYSKNARRFGRAKYYK